MGEPNVAVITPERAQYVRGVQRTVNSAAHRWDQRWETGTDFDKKWETHLEVRKHKKKHNIIGQITDRSPRHII